MKFQKFTRGGYEYVIYKIYSEEDGGRYPIHGSVLYKGCRQSTCWRSDGINETNYSLNLIPIKKRRFKTAEELISDKNTEVVFKGDGSIVVRRGVGTSSEAWRRYPEDKLEQNYPYDELWLNVFTVLE